MPLGLPVTYGKVHFLVIVRVRVRQVDTRHPAAGVARALQVGT